MLFTDYLIAIIVIVVLLLMLTVGNWQFWLAKKSLKEIWSSQDPIGSKILWTVIGLVSITCVGLIIQFIFNRLF